MEKNVIAKIVLLGDGAVGKTSLVRRFVKDEYSDEYISTIGSKTSKKEIVYRNMADDFVINLKLIIVDIHGQKTFSKLHASNYMGSKGALLVFDMTRKETLENISDWINGLYDTVGEIPVITLGNKYDLISEFDDRASEMDFDEFLREEHPQVIEFYEENPEFGDIPSFDRVEESDIEQLSEDINTKYFKTSAKTGENVEGSFRMLGENILESMIQKGGLR